MIAPFRRPRPARLVRLDGPFDRPGTAATPATPTCCCCCCLVTTLTASTVAAVTVHREAEIDELDGGRRRLLTAAAAATVCLGGVPVWLAGVAGAGRALRDAPDGLIITLWVTAVLATWLVWMRLVLGWAGSPARPAWWWSAKFTLATGLAFTAELMTLGLFVYGQLAAIPVAVFVGVVMRRRFKAAAT